MCLLIYIKNFIRNKTFIYLKKSVAYQTDDLSHRKRHLIVYLLHTLFKAFRDKIVVSGLFFGISAGVCN